MDDLVRMSQSDLESLYMNSVMGIPPVGFAPARAIINPGSHFTVSASRATRVVWQGKIFRNDGIMVNRIVGLRLVHARVYSGTSWLDGHPSLILDYSGTSRLFPKVRDEVREISPGLYLGITHVRRDSGPKLVAFFALDARGK